MLPFSAAVRQAGFAATGSPRHDHLFSSFSWQGAAPLSLKALRKVLGEFPEHVYRAKGFLYLKDCPQRRFVLHLVGSRLDIQLQGPGRGKRSRPATWW
ncbi:GTP-binding protein [Pseudomonas piscis]